MKYGLQQLSDIECIKQLKYRYMRAIDTRDLPLLATCFTPDVTTSYTDGQYVLSGPDAIAALVLEALGGTGSSHELSHPEITFLNEDNASAIWRLTETVHYMPGTGPEKIGSTRVTGKEVMTAASYYYDDYVRLEGEWKIYKTGYKRLFEHIEVRQGEVSVAPDRVA